MYDIVNEVERYPEFLPWCEQAQVHTRTDESLRATLVLAKGPVRQRLMTTNKMVPGQSISLSLADGPFRYLHGQWMFTAVNLPENQGGSKIELHLDFEFRNRLLDKTFGRVFTPISNSLVDAFCQRADVLYGG